MSQERSLDDVDHPELVRLAAEFFDKGLADGSSGKTLQRSYAVRHWLTAHGYTHWRIFHVRSLRQIYGAGYDIAKASSRLKEKGVRNNA